MHVVSLIFISSFKKQARRVMTSKMKGFFKGLRYITQIFEFGDDEEKEEEMQIGLPTDVKHVAHIGSDAPSVEPPSWMNEFKQGQESPATLNSGSGGPADHDPRAVSEDSTQVRRGGKKDGPRSNGTSSMDSQVPEGGVPRSSRRSSNGGLQQQQQDSTSNNSDNQPATSSKKEASTTRTRKSRRNPSKDMSSSSSTPAVEPMGIGDLPSRDIPATRKTTTTNRKKTRDAASRSRSNSTSKPSSSAAAAASSASATATADDGPV